MHDDDASFHRPNYLAIVSLVLGCLSLMGQVISLCFFPCSIVILAIPTVLTLATGYFGWRQAQQTNDGREVAIVGIILGLISLTMSLFWVAIAFLYFLVIAAVVVLENLT
ncbi:MAG: hypothetical protein JRI25_01395 [Deltaproteobacteria bacterium]|nr:hypothetical protein [Deltaproteobacteria bacterium]MBW2253234.1 hypothetical protein [Deltaproteobacteria bacterium]